MIAVLAAAALALPAAAPERPPVAWTPIPFSAERRRQMAAYSRRHYGLDRHRLMRPRAIVQHMTAGPSFRSAFETFSANVPDPELGELPGVCAHFVIDRAGTIHQLVPIGLMCRHTVGLNWTAIGIEHVGYRAEEVLSGPQLGASLRLTAWLRCRERVALRDVIGHNENVGSRWHRERVARLRRQTHGDWPAAAMRRYRAALARIACS
jgi:N-acetyl-anhydromuramyl-L-alanine amidase AmpD